MFQEFNIALPRRAEKVYDLRDFGAVEGGKISNTRAFAAAIDAAAQNGGRQCSDPV
ncbi:MAG: hypothetical protein IJ147_09225 [Lachnospiraceae bacterium]|nr:hypothetical protein [Lachnospiraceae bacterium]